MTEKILPILEAHSGFATALFQMFVALGHAAPTFLRGLSD
jgi:hypothetical protein